MTGIIRDIICNAGIIRYYARNLIRYDFAKNYRTFVRNYGIPDVRGIIDKDFCNFTTDKQLKLTYE